MDMFYCKNWPCDIVIKYSLNSIYLDFFVVSDSQCNVLTGHNCALEIIWSVISWYMSYHSSFKKKTWGCLIFFLCVYNAVKQAVFTSWVGNSTYNAGSSYPHPYPFLLNKLGHYIGCQKPQKNQDKCYLMNI
jgi:hypothetical protein